MTTRLPNREDLAAMLDAVRAEPDGPDKVVAIERLEAQLADLDEPGPDMVERPDADLAERPPEEETPAAPVDPAPAKPAAKPFGAAPKGEDEPAKKPDNKPF